MTVPKRLLQNTFIFTSASLIVVIGILALFSVPAIAPDHSSPRVQGSQTVIEPRSSPLPETILAGPLKISEPDYSNITAKSFLVYDQASGVHLAEQAIDAPVAIASLTKLMTALVVYQRAPMHETLTINQSDTFAIRPVLGLAVGDEVTYLDLFNAMLVGSANDAALTLANHVSNSANVPFSQLMNEHAQHLGMRDTHFSNSLGFDSEQNYSTARDLRLLINAAENHTAFAMLGRKTSYSFVTKDNKTFSIRTTNRLLAGDPEVQAIKTGYTSEAQGAMATQINHEGNSFIIIVLQSDNREQDTLKLKKMILKSYQWDSPIN